MVETTKLLMRNLRTRERKSENKFFLFKEIIPLRVMEEREAPKEGQCAKDEKLVTRVQKDSVEGKILGKNFAVFPARNVAR